MARYEKEFWGMPGEFTESRGLDPNYRDGYHGMRMVGGNGRAAYGAHRWAREGDLEREGGYRGAGAWAKQSQSGPWHPDDVRWEERDRDRSPYDAHRAMHDFDSRDQAFAPPPPNLGYHGHRER